MGRFSEMFSGIERQFSPEEPAPEGVEYKETPRAGWKDSTIEHPHMPIDGRDFESYKLFFELDPEQLRDKVVLDLGSGSVAKLAADLHRLGITDKTISLSPDFSIEKSGKKVTTNNPTAQPVAGLGQALPFAEQSIDTILAYHVFEHVSKEVLVEMLSEMCRVLKTDGVAHTGPAFLDEDIMKFIAENQSLQNNLTQTNVMLSFREISQDIIPHSRGLDMYSSPLKLKPQPYDIILKKS